VLATIPAVVSITVMIMVPVTMIAIVAIVIVVPVSTLPVVIRTVICRRDDGDTRKTNAYTDIRISFGGCRLGNAGHSERST